MSANILPTIEYLRTCFHYDNGRLFWKARPEIHFSGAKSCNNCNAQFANKEAGNMSSVGRWQVKLAGKSYLRSRIVWAIHNDRWPSGDIDHINHDMTDDRIDNLRDATTSQNTGNSRKSRANTSGYKGVCWHKRDDKWRAQIGVRGKKKDLGNYDTPEAAYAAYVAAAKMEFAEFACAG